MLPQLIMEWRRILGEVGLKRRYGAMSAGELLYQQQCLQAVSLLFAAAVDADNPEDEEDVEIAGALIAAEVMDARVDRTMITPVRGRSLISTTSWSRQEAWGDYRFRKRDIRRLSTALHLPAVWVCEKKSRFPGETPLLLLLLLPRPLRYATD